MKTEKITYSLNRQLELTACEGHFAGRHSHTNYYLDITQIKHRHTQARLAAIELAQRYILMRNVDTIVCLDGSEVIGAFLAWNLSKKDFRSINVDKNIHVVTPEYDMNHQMIFRDNLLPMIQNKDVLVLISTVNSGFTAKRAIQTIRYYGGRPQGIAAVFSAAEQVADVPVFSLFTPEDIPGYVSAPAGECPLCAKGEAITGLINSYGFSKL